MSIQKVLAASLAGIVLLAPVSVAIAQATDPAAIVKQRQDLMKADGGLLKKAMTGSADESAQALQQLHDNLATLKTLFPEGSMTPDSKALPVIWQQNADFMKLFDEAQAGADKAMADAKAGNSDAVSGDLRAVFRVCGDCHKTYRAPLQ